MSASASSSNASPTKSPAAPNKHSPREPSTWGEGGEPLALRFIDAVEHSFGRIGRSPNIGSLRFSFELEIPAMRARPLGRFPYTVFYVVDDDDQVDVWRLLDSRRHTPATLTDDMRWIAPSAHEIEIP